MSNNIPDPLMDIPGTSPIISFLQGLALPFRSALFLLSHPRLWGYVIVPLITNALLFILMLVFGWYWFHDFISSSLASRTGWLLGLLSGAIGILFWLLSLLVIYFVFTPVALIISSPFNDFLSERTESLLHIRSANESSWRQLPLEIIFILKNEAIRMITTFAVLGAIFTLNFLPIIGQTLYIVLGFYWASRCAAYEFTSYSADRRKMSFREKWKMICVRKSLTLGFGMITVLLLLIPFVNILTVSLSAIGGTLLFAEIYTKK